MLETRRGRLFGFGILYISEGIPFGFSTTAMVVGVGARYRYRKTESIRWQEGMDIPLHGNGNSHTGYNGYC